jgi:hypothetical protein
MAECLKAGWPNRIKIFFIVASVSDAAADILIFILIYPPVQVICNMRMNRDMPDRFPEFPGNPKDSVSNFIKKIHWELFAILCAQFIF